jgi:FtsH-binding integral membrane protein
MSTRFASWVTVGVPAAFLVVATAAFPLETIKWLAFAISVGALYVSAYIAYSYRKDVASLVTALVTGAISAWTIVASLVFSLGTVQNLALASALALSGLALAGLVEHELENEHIVQAHETEDGERRHSLAAA